MDVADRRRRGIELQRGHGDSPPGSRLTVLGSFNLDLIPPFLVEALDRRGIAAEVVTGDFGQIAAQALNPGSQLYEGDPGDVLVVSAVEDALATLYASPGEVEDADALVDDRLAEIGSAVSAMLERLPESACYVVAFGTDRVPSAHVLDPSAGARGQRAVTRFLDGVRDLAELSPRVVVVDWDWHLRGVGARHLTDDRLWYLGRMRLSPDGLAELAELTARHVAAARGAARKVAVVDLDGTLWGGVVGEAGVTGLELGEEGAGPAYRDFQRELARLSDAGVVLAIASKNNHEDAAAVFEDHPGMVLALSDFAAHRINWNDKATSLCELAEELSLGLDSFVFLDDNPVEREWVAQALPEVVVPELPQDPAHRPAFLRDAGLFDRVVMTDADRGRSASYAAQGSRSRLKAGSMSFEDFLRSLEQVVTIEPVTDATLPRAVQLCQRTNQFNLTTRRHTAADLERMMASHDHSVFALSVADRFGDSGLTGLAILAVDGEAAEMDTLLLSCRVLGRRVEDALLAFVAERADAAGARRLVGRYEPTGRNQQVASFYADRGFEQAGAGEFHLDLSATEVPMPEEMKVSVNAGA